MTKWSGRSGSSVMSGSVLRGGSRVAWSVSLCALLSLWSATAAAQLTQPNGTVIPQTNNLRDFLNGQGETINPLTDAAITPETFTPKCELTFTVIGRGAGYRNSFGWYNVTGSKPANNELYEFVACSDVVGVTKTLDLRNDIRYLGGEIGFFQATSENHDNDDRFCFSNCGPNCAAVGNYSATVGYVFYSEARYNPDSGSSPTIHLLTMDSRVFPNAFYFGWEDKYSGNDNDFEDLLMRVEGVQCAGGGAACETGMPGVCADGMMQCRNGVLSCVGSREPGDESCNALDDDCDGTNDEGDGLCAVGQVCDRGRCIGDCGLDGICPDGLVCAESTGRCVDPTCIQVECDAGEVCVEGTCRAPCEDVVCPFGQHCRSGVCVEQCLGGCEEGQVCDDGVCISCDCDRCHGDNVCSQDVGMCVEPACASMTCTDGTHCEAGECIDNCEGVVCPRGFTCSAGACVAQSDGGSGGDGGSSGTGGLGGAGGVSGLGGTGGVSGFGGTGGVSGVSGGVGGTSGTGGSGGFGGASGSSAPADPGCACSSVGHRSRSLNFGWLLVGLGLLASRMHRRRATR